MCLQTMARSFLASTAFELESATYTVVEKEGDFCIMQYDPKVIGAYFSA
jgi:hypothetical protein